MKKRWLLPGLLFLMGADDPWVDASKQDLHGYVRALSLDLRGVVPSSAELLEIEAAGRLSDEMLESWLHDPAFEEQVIVQHRELVWNHLEINLMPTRKLNRRDGISFNNNRSRHTRGVGQTHCGDFPADIDAWNRPRSWVTNEDGSISEGYVVVSPYWDPDNPIEVCAFDAQTMSMTTTGVDCTTADGHQEQECGCGPNLQWCFDGTTERMIEESISADVSERIRHMLQRDGSYGDLFSDTTMFVNGPSAHFFRYLVPFDPETYESPVPVDSLPDLAFTDTAWTTVTLGDDHDGILTAPGWLLRHQTNRGRANRFYGGFLCNQFVLPEGGVGTGDASAAPTPDLTRRAGCLGCHARLEPWAAYWGRWGEAAMVYRSADAYPAFEEECRSCATLSSVDCPDHCEDHYLIEMSHADERAYLGWYLPYAFLTDGKEEHPDLGPLGWVDAATADGSLDACAVQNASKWLLNMEADSDQLEAWSAELGPEAGYRDLIRTLVNRSEYWGGTP